MNTVYLIGGSPRSGKTIIFNELIRQRPMIAISSDALRESVRYALIEEPFVTINHLTFQGDAIFHRSGESKDISHTKHFSQEVNQEDLTWKTVVGIINYYDQKEGISMIIEGMAVTPEHIKSLSLKNSRIRAAFLGYTDDSDIDSILKYAHTKKDWVYKKIMKEDGGDDSAVRRWFKEECQKNKDVELLAKKFGYGFFSPSGKLFEEYRDTVVKYLLG